MNFRTLLASALLLGCSRDPDLATRVETKIRATLPDADVQIADPSTLKVKRNTSEATLSLADLRDACAKSDAECESGIDQAIAKLAVATSPKVTKEAIRSMLATQPDLEAVAQQLKQLPAEKREAGNLIARAIGADLYEVLVVQTPSGMRMMTKGEAVEMKLEPQELATIAHENMKTALAKMTTKDEGNGVLRLDCGDDYEAARLEVPELWKGIAAKVDGELLVIASNRSRVFLTGSKNTAGLGTLKALATAALAKEPHPLSLAVFRLTPEGFVSSL